MNKLNIYIKSYHPMVHILMMGTLFISLSNSMSVVYLPIFLLKSPHLDPILVGFIVGAGALTATIGGFIGGTLSDIIGRNRLLYLSLLVLGLVFLAFIITSSPSILVLLNVVRGLFSSFFLTISKALMADWTPKEKRFKVFSNRYMAGNLGYSIGPIVGTIFGVAGNTNAFLLTAIIYLGYLLAMVILIRIFSIREIDMDMNEKLSIREAWNVFRKDNVLLLFIIGSIFITAVHGEMSVTFSQYLEQNIYEGIKLFGYLMSLNGITVIIAQVSITRRAEKYGLFHRILLGCSLFAIAEIGFAFSTSWAAFFLCMVIFTFGEILIIPSEYAQIDEITPSGMRGMYYGAQGFSEFGNFVGPWLGGYLLVSFGGKIMFLTFAFFCVIGVLFYGWGRKAHHTREKHRKELITLKL